MYESAFVGYEYKSIQVKRRMQSVYADGYENFGWEFEGTEEPKKLTLDTVVMKFRRDRKLRNNRMELTRLQRNFDACVSEILSLEASKQLKASVTAYGIGVVGTAFMAGSVFVLTAGHIVPSVILAIPAVAGWVLPHFLFRSMEKKRTAQVAPLIDQKYDELYAVCEKAYDLREN